MMSSNHTSRFLHRVLYFMSRASILTILLLLVSGCAQTRTLSRAPVEPHRQTVHFGFNKTSVRAEDRGILKDVAFDLKRKQKAVAIVEGHADKVGSARYNEILAERRARAVRVYLRNLGADHRRLTILSKGEREPVAHGWTGADHQQNRRVEIIMSLVRGE